MNVRKNNPIPLTHRRQQLIKAYLNSKDYRDQMYNCIYATVKRKVSGDKFDELKSVAHEGLVKAARNFKTRTGAKFKSFAYLNIQSSVKSYLKYLNTKKRSWDGEIISLQSNYYDSELTMEDVISDKSSTADQDVVQKSIVADILKHLNKFERKVTLLYMDGYSDKQIAKMTHHSLADVQNVKNVAYKRTDIQRLGKMLDKII